MINNDFSFHITHLKFRKDEESRFTFNSVSTNFRKRIQPNFKS